VSPGWQHAFATIPSPGSGPTSPLGRRLRTRPAPAFASSGRPVAPLGSWQRTRRGVRRGVRRLGHGFAARGGVGRAWSHCSGPATCAIALWHPLRHSLWHPLWRPEVRSKRVPVWIWCGLANDRTKSGPPAGRTTPGWAAGSIGRREFGRPVRWGCTKVGLPDRLGRSSSGGRPGRTPGDRVAGPVGSHQVGLPDRLGSLSSGDRPGRTPGDRAAGPVGSHQAVLLDRSRRTRSDRTR
jgi:hypothetical protein